MLVSNNWPYQEAEASFSWPRERYALNGVCGGAMLLTAYSPSLAQPEVYLTSEVL